MNTGKHHLLDFLEFTNLEQLVVPEIQRDYVWQTENILDLLETFQEGFSDERKDIPYLGFIYAFKDKDYAYRYFLVDGQQRITSVYLLLLVCYQKSGKKFPAYLLKDGRLKLDYKVRQATHEFLSELVDYCRLNPFNPDFIITDQIWFHKGYENDISIGNMTLNYGAIRKWLERFDHEQLLKFLKFIEDKVELSYFNIESGREGEDLYIYMNSRGRQLETNETVKARFLTGVRSEQDHLTWGEKWERWQDFFWKHRGKNPDADARFNEFLRQLQIIQMCQLRKKDDEISGFVSGKTDEPVSMELLPKRLEEVEAYFEAFTWLTESADITAFCKAYLSENFLTVTPEGERRQIYYLRLLPVLAFVATSECRDEKIIIRFIRFFYNISRKTMVGKDISGQLPRAVRLMLLYCTRKQSGFDVCDLSDYSKNRTRLIDEEELRKMELYRNPPVGSTREEMEKLFGDAEDHSTFFGEIAFLLFRYYDEKTSQLHLEQYKLTWRAFNTLFPVDGRNDGMVARVLLFYGATWIQVTPYYYNNYNTQDWYSLVRENSGRHLADLLEDMHEKPLDHLDVIIRKKITGYFISKNLRSVALLKSADSLLDQIRILTAIDYHTDRKLWRKPDRCIAEDARYTSDAYGDTPFFAADKVLYNMHRYINDGGYGRILRTLNDVLQDDERLSVILQEILVAGLK
jgi:hypothetical protein